MKQLFAILFALGAATFSSAQDITGDWNGTLKPGGGELRLVLHITKNADGSLKATLDSIDQGANGIPVNAVTLKDSKLNLKVDHHLDQHVSVSCVSDSSLPPRIMDGPSRLLQSYSPKRDRCCYSTTASPLFQSRSLEPCSRTGSYAPLRLRFTSRNHDRHSG